MKSSIIIGIMTLTMLVAGCGKKPARQEQVPPYRGPTLTQQAVDENIAEERTNVEHSQVVAYAIADTNRMPKIVFTVSEIWKGAHDATMLGVTNGTQFSIDGSGIRGGLPDAAIVSIPEASSPSVARQRARFTFVRSGRVFTLTVQEIKARLGL